MGKNNKIFKRVPIFGKIEVGLQKESQTVYRCYIKHINRLKEVDHLGVLHYFLKIPRYTRYDYVMTMLYLIEKAIQSKSIKNNTLKLSEASFTNVEEFLKSWCLIYCIGHFQMTFTAEHAFLRFLVEEKKEKEFLDDLKNRIFNSEIFQNEDENVKNHLYSTIEDKIKNQEVMEVYKIFSLLKTMDKTSCLGKHKDQIRELLKITILKKDYLQYLDKNIDRRIKLGKIIDYFEIIRKLSFTILDGYVSQEYLKVNPFVIIENLDKFMEKNDYNGLLNDINKFYSADIYISQESAYYHHRARKSINEEKIFKDNINELIDDIIENKEDDNGEIKLDKDIKDVIKKEHKKLEGKQDPQYMNDELNNSIRIKIPVLNDSIDNEIDYIQPPIFGGIMYNFAGSNYEIDIYPNSEIFGKTENKIYDVLKGIDQFYSTLTIPLMIPGILYQFIQTLFKLLDNVSDFHQKVNEPENKDICEIELVENFVESIDQYKDFFSSTPVSPLFDDLESDNLVELLERFREVASYVISNVIPSKALHYSKLQLSNGKLIRFPILFKHSELEKVIKLLERTIPPHETSQKVEMEKNLEILKNENEIEDHGAFYIFAPNTVFKRNEEEREIDLLLIKVLGASDPRTKEVFGQLENNRETGEAEDNKEIIIILGETKSGSNFDRDQSINQLELVLGIPNRTASLLWESKESEKGNIEVNIESLTTDDSKMIVFRKNEQSN